MIAGLLAAVCFYMTQSFSEHLKSEYPPEGVRWSLDSKRAKNGWDNIWWQVIPPGGTMEMILSNAAPIWGSYCYGFEAEHGQQSVEVRAYIVREAQRYRAIPAADDEWAEVYTTNLCYPQDRLAMISIKNLASKQTVRIARNIEQRNKTPPSGYLAGLCRGASTSCPEPMRGWGQYLLNYKAAKAEEAARRPYLITFGIALVLLTLASLNGFHNTAATLFPSELAKRTRAHLHRTSRSGERYDPNTHQAYRDRSKSTFRRQQDIDDLGQIVTEAKDELSRAKDELERLKRAETSRKKAFKTAEAEFNEAVKRARAAQEKLETARRRMEGQ